MDVASLNIKYGFVKELVFKEITTEITVINVNTVRAGASISLTGGQVLTWRPKSQEVPVIWVSKLLQYVPGKAIRGGVVAKPMAGHADLAATAGAQRSGGG